MQSVRTGKKEGLEKVGKARTHARTHKNRTGDKREAQTKREIRDRPKLAEVTTTGPNGPSPLEGAGDGRGGSQITIHQRFFLFPFSSLLRFLTFLSWTLFARHRHPVEKPTSLCDKQTARVNESPRERTLCTPHLRECCGVDCPAVQCV